MEHKESQEDQGMCCLHQADVLMCSPKTTLVVFTSGSRILTCEPVSISSEITQILMDDSAGKIRIGFAQEEPELLPVH